MAFVQPDLRQVKCYMVFVENDLWKNNSYITSQMFCDKSYVIMRIGNVTVDKSYVIMRIENVTVDKSYVRMRIENVTVDKPYV